MFTYCVRKDIHLARYLEKESTHSPLIEERETSVHMNTESTGAIYLSLILKELEMELKMMGRACYLIMILETLLEICIL